MPVRTSEAEWTGNLTAGKGSIKLGSGAFEGKYDWGSRSGDAPGTNPEELIGAAHAGCFTMALSAQLGNAGITPTRLHTTAKVHLIKNETGFVIPKIELELEGEVPGIDATTFDEHAHIAKANCPVSKALTGTEITLNVKLI
jgi:lipoyl-dependent peroxiredoxin